MQNQRTTADVKSDKISRFMWRENLGGESEFLMYKLVGGLETAWHGVCMELFGSGCIVGSDIRQP